MNQFEGMIEKFTIDIAKVCPHLEKDDIRNDLWVFYLETKNRWDKEKGSLSSYLYQFLKWRKIDTITKYYKEENFVKNLPAFGFNYTLTGTNQIELNFDTFCEKIKLNLKPVDQKIFDLLVNSSKHLDEFMGSINTARKNKEVTQLHKYMGCYRRKINRSMLRIKDKIKKILENSYAQ